MSMIVPIVGVLVAAFVLTPAWGAVLLIGAVRFGARREVPERAAGDLDNRLSPAREGQVAGRELANSLQYPRSVS
jgi:hypothetical protein